ncbi:hypothetical protein Celaphus_00015970, partial [Cervus elaphus hippelaphus]
MSYESHLSYDQPQKKNKDCENFTLVKNNTGPIQKLPNIKENKSEKLQPTGANSAKLEKVLTNTLPVWPDLPLP